MRNLALYGIIVFLLGSCNSDERLTLGERIDGPANIRDTINGEVLFNLNDDVLVECTESANGWCVVGTEVEITEEEGEASLIKKGKVLKGIDGKVAGEALNNLSVGMSREDNGKTYGLIAGYTYKKNINTKSIPENALSDLINEEGKNLSKEDLSDFMKDFRFEKYNDNVEEYFIYENSLDDPSPRDRITLVFKNNQLSGIVHSRALSLDGFKTYELIRGHKFTPIIDLSEKEIIEIKRSKIDFYNSID